MHILMLSAENGALPGGKVGGLGDVMRDLPVALARAGHRVSVVTPGYDVFPQLAGAEQLMAFTAEFAGRSEQLTLHALPKLDQADGVKQYCIDHPLFYAGGRGRIYVHNGEGPFAADAQKFALFCSACCELVASGQFGEVDVVNCNDWHTAPYLILRSFSERFDSLRAIRAVFSIHNLALQGVRPLRAVESALESWYPGLGYAIELVADPSYPDCINLLRAGITLADAVGTVSPTYAREILLPSVPEEGLVRGEGLEEDLAQVAAEGRLVGILNGCDYDKRLPMPVKPAQLWALMENCLEDWIEENPHATRSYYYAHRLLQRLKRKRKHPAPLLLSIGRLTSQKVGLLTQPYGEHFVIDEMLERLSSGVFILCGSGDLAQEQFFTDVMRRHQHFLFLCGYSESMSETLYSTADLFLMPSVFEPCGISQMLAMRAGMPCLVHAVGGLKDSVIDGVNGFSFEGNDPVERLDHLLACLDRALTTFEKQADTWHALTRGARESRFSWDEAAAQYCERLYAAS